ncbi:LuxR C-terminal-related transcriptional regulator [Rouxiella sp. Mn2063]|uniref:helix-turn-helix transcriptional regulator n=1 Tax=Rouxiella sp. Mn2063 TaxID=3395262 RepID=UPI003BE8EAC5
MLNILTISDNFPYILGLNALFKILADKKNIELFFLLKSEPNNKGIANVIIRDSIVSISVFKNKEPVPLPKNINEVNKITLHIPFMWKQDNLTVIMSKIEKILLIANTDYQSLIKKSIYKNLGLKDYLQLSVMERQVMFLIGKGYDNQYISNLLDRSEKTISVHCRNATRKMGMTNRVEFYRYASFIANCANKEGNTLCL